MNDAMMCRTDPANSDESGTPHPHEHLDAEGIQALLAYEETHGHRAAILRALNERLRAVRSGTDPHGPLGEHLPRASTG
jgi:hypothetical protein